LLVLAHHPGQTLQIHFLKTKSGESDHPLLAFLDALGFFGAVDRTLIVGVGNPKIVSIYTSSCYCKSQLHIHIRYA
jgi:hypothetical protein